MTFFTRYRARPEFSRVAARWYDEALERPCPARCRVYRRRLRKQVVTHCRYLAIFSGSHEEALLTIVHMISPGSMGDLKKVYRLKTPLIRYRARCCRHVGQPSVCARAGTVSRLLNSPSFQCARMALHTPQTRNLFAFHLSAV